MALTKIRFGIRKAWWFPLVIRLAVITDNERLFMWALKGITVAWPASHNK